METQIEFNFYYKDVGDTGDFGDPFTIYMKQKMQNERSGQSGNYQGSAGGDNELLCAIKKNVTYQRRNHLPKISQ